MRGIAYIVAALAAVGIMIGIATFPESESTVVDEPTEVQPAVAETSSTQPNTAGRVMSEAGTLTLSVPTMHCEFACYPSVKKVLEESESVQGVELAEQKEPGVLDNRAVVVQYDAGFDLDAAIAQLGEEGFKEAELVQ